MSSMPWSSNKRGGGAEERQSLEKITGGISLGEIKFRAK